MTPPSLAPATAGDDSNESDAIVVSFDTKWHQLLTRRGFSVVIRKRVPKTRPKKWMYLHIKSPIGAICARAELTAIGTMTVAEAVSRKKDIGLSAEEIRSYIGAEEAIGYYQLGRIQLAQQPATTALLMSNMRYFPPQSFLVLSRDAKAVIDELTGFQAARKDH